MDVANLLLNAENLRTLLLLVAVVAGIVWTNKQIDEKTKGLATREELNGLGTSLRQEMAGLAASLRQEIDERFNAFHKLLKENDFAHLNETIKALTFTLKKNKYLDADDKRYIDSHLDDK